MIGDDDDFSVGFVVGVVVTPPVRKIWHVSQIRTHQGKVKHHDSVAVIDTVAGHMGHYEQE